ncbi:MAG: hypothetical protein ACI3XQ_07000 [Eubacteriales bacterium]
MHVEFEDFRIQCETELEDKAISFLYEAAGELEAQTKRNSTPGKKYGGREAKSLWEYIVDEIGKEATVGSPYEAGYWEELGTGAHALNHDGRRGWWVYVEGNDTPRENQKYYTEEEAKETAAFLRSKGLDAHATNGSEPNRPLYRAFQSKKSAIIRRAQQIFEGL